MGGRASRRRVVVLALALAAAAPAACGGTGVEDVEQRLRDELSDQLDRQRAREEELRESGALEAGAPLTPTVDRVDCPDGADLDTGASFRCRAVGPGDRTVGNLSVLMLADGRPSWQFTAAGLA